MLGKHCPRLNSLPAAIIRNTLLTLIIYIVIESSGGKIKYVSVIRRDSSGLS